jgi:tetratricopeptide (TPR) repeat protein
VYLINRRFRAYTIVFKNSNVPLQKKMKSILLLVIIVNAYIGSFAQAGLQRTNKLKLADSFYTKGDWQMAVQEYEDIIKADSSVGNAAVYNRIGYSYHNLKNYQTASKFYKIALTKNSPQQLLPFIYSRLARSYSLMNEKKLALESFDKAISTGYINVGELKEHKDFDNLRMEPKFNELASKLIEKVNPCSANPKYSEFDFWIGNWNVFQTGTNFMVGKNRIEKSTGGCVLLETWESSTGGETGQSLNYIDKKNGKWNQTYVGSRGEATIYFDGELIENSMIFKYESHKKDGSIVKGKFVFKKLSNGDVQQFQEETIDEGKTWRIVFDFTYKKSS